MPTDPAILGFSNRWYPEAVKTATHVRLNDRIVIRVITGPAFVATKLEAFVSRGGSDILSRHDRVYSQMRVVWECALAAEEHGCMTTVLSSQC
jgi:predicted nucleotidyltransferase